MVKTSEFAGRLFVVSGAASGIGFNLTQKIVDLGGQVCAIDFNVQGLETLTGSVGNLDLLSSFKCDVTNEKEISDTVTKIGEQYGKIDGLINAAGIVRAKEFLDFDTTDWEKTFAVNVFGTYLLIKHATKYLNNATSPRIVNFASMAGKIAGAYTAPYAASKAAVISLTRSAAVALAPKINVNCVCPGIIQTPMWDGLGSDLAEIGFKDHFENRSSQTPLMRPGTSEEVTNVVLFLLSDASAYITGEDVNVSGGLVMH